MPRRMQTKKSIVKKANTNAVRLKLGRKEMRFSVSLVVLIGLLTFSVLLLLFSLNKSAAVGAKTMTSFSVPRISRSIPLKKTSANLTTFQGGGEDFQLAFPASWKGWVYRTGEVKSPVDDTLSDQYVKIYLPDSNPKEATNPDLDSRYTDMITVVTYSADEWKAMAKKCNKGDSSVCDEMGTKLADTTCPGFADNTDCVYSYTKQPNCPGSLTTRCDEVDTIMANFKLVK